LKVQIRQTQAAGEVQVLAKLEISTSHHHQVFIFTPSRQGALADTAEISGTQI